MTDEARFLKKKKKIGGANLGPMGLNQAQNEIFCYFLESGSLVFLEIACSDSLQQHRTSSRDNILFGLLVSLKFHVVRAYFRKIKHPGIGCFIKSALFEIFFLNFNKMCQKHIQIRGIQPLPALLDCPNALLSNKGALL